MTAVGVGYGIGIGRLLGAVLDWLASTSCKLVAVGLVLFSPFLRRDRDDLDRRSFSFSSMFFSLSSPENVVHIWSPSLPLESLDLSSSSFLQFC